MQATEVPVRAVREVGPGTVAIEVATPEGFDALPGQFVLVRGVLDGEEFGRHYTISSPDVEDTFELTVGIDPDGDLSPWLADREEGDAVAVEGPFGAAAYDAATDGDVAVLAGGPGVGPAVGIAEAAVRAGHDAAVVYEDDRPAHEDRLSGLAVAGTTVEVVTGDGFEPAVADLAARGLGGGALGPHRVYVYGFQPFVERALDALDDAGVDVEEVNVESFG